MTDDRRTRRVSVQQAWDEHNLSQLVYFRSLPLRTKLEAVQGMVDVLRRFQEMRDRGEFKPASGVTREPHAEGRGD